MTSALPSPLRAQTPDKATTQSKILERNGVGITAVFGPEQEYAPSVNTPTKKEYEVYLDRWWKIPPGTTPADPLSAFWRGLTNYNVTLRDQHGNPLFNTPQFQWSFEGAGSLLPVPTGTTGTELLQKDLTLSHDSKILPHDLGEAILPPELPLDINDTPAEIAAAQSQLNAYLEFAKEFPKSTTIKAVASGSGPQNPGAPAAIPLEAKINWHIPHQSHFEFDVEIEIELPDGETIDYNDLSDEIDLAEAVLDLVNEPEWQDVEMHSKLKTAMPRMAAQATKTAFKAVAEIAVETVATRGAGRAFRALKASEIGPAIFKRMRPSFQATFQSWSAARIAAGKPVGKMVFKLRTRRVGVLGSPHLSRLLRGRDLNRVIEAADDAIDIVETGTELLEAAKPKPEPREETISNDDSKDATEDEQRETLGAPYFFYSNNINAITAVNGIITGCSDVYTKPTSDTRQLDKDTPRARPRWPSGYYLTNLHPSRTEQLRSGQHSFALFSHPYNWETAPGTAPGTIYCWGIDPGLIPLNSLGSAFYWTGTPNGNERVQNSSRYHVNPVDPQSGSTGLIGMRVVGNPDGTPLTLHFVPGAPGKDDVPPGSRGPNNPAYGTWLDPSTGQPWVETVNGTLNFIDVEKENPATGRKYKADSDWVPSNATLKKILGTKNGGKVSYRRGFPDFSPWIVRLPDLTVLKYVLPFMKGTRGFYESDYKLSSEWTAGKMQDSPPLVPPANEPFDTSVLFQNGGTTVNIDQVKEWMGGYKIQDPADQSKVIDCRLTWHHFEDMKTMQLVPLLLNSQASHDGGATFAVKARWP